MAGTQAEAKTSRNTVQRTLVLEAVRSLRNHPTSADVYEKVRQQTPSISRATVYRNLGVLAERGDVLRVEVPNATTSFSTRTIMQSVASADGFSTLTCPIMPTSSTR